MGGRTAKAAWHGSSERDTSENELEREEDREESDNGEDIGTVIRRRVECTVN